MSLHKSGSRIPEPDHRHVPSRVQSQRRYLGPCSAESRRLVAMSLRPDVTASETSNTNKFPSTRFSSHQRAEYTASVSFSKKDSSPRLLRRLNSDGEWEFYIPTLVKDEMKVADSELDKKVRKQAGLGRNSTSQTPVTNVNVGEKLAQFEQRLEKKREPASIMGGETRKHNTSSQKVLLNQSLSKNTSRQKPPIAPRYQSKGKPSSKKQVVLPKKGNQGKNGNSKPNTKGINPNESFCQKSKVIQRITDSQMVCTPPADDDGPLPPAGRILSPMTQNRCQRLWEMRLRMIQIQLEIEVEEAMKGESDKRPKITTKTLTSLKNCIIPVDGINSLRPILAYTNIANERRAGSRIQNLTERQTTSLPTAVPSKNIPHPLYQSENSKSIRTSCQNSEPNQNCHKTQTFQTGSKLSQPSWSNRTTSNIIATPVTSVLDPKPSRCPNLPKQSEIALKSPTGIMGCSNYEPAPLQIMSHPLQREAPKPVRCLVSSKQSKIPLKTHKTIEKCLNYDRKSLPCTAYCQDPKESSPDRRWQDIPEQSKLPLKTAIVEFSNCEPTSMQYMSCLLQKEIPTPWRCVDMVKQPELPLKTTTEEWSIPSCSSLDPQGWQRSLYSKLPIEDKLKCKARSSQEASFQDDKEVSKHQRSDLENPQKSKLPLKSQEPGKDYSQYKRVLLPCPSDTDAKECSRITGCRETSPKLFTKSKTVKANPDYEKSPASLTPRRDSKGIKKPVANFKQSQLPMTNHKTVAKCSNYQPTKPYTYVLLPEEPSQNPRYRGYQKHHKLHLKSQSAIQECSTYEPKSQYKSFQDKKEELGTMRFLDNAKSSAFPLKKQKRKAGCSKCEPIASSKLPKKGSKICHGNQSHHHAYTPWLQVATTARQPTFIQPKSRRQRHTSTAPENESNPMLGNVGRLPPAYIHLLNRLEEHRKASKLARVGVETREQASQYEKVCTKPFSELISRRKSSCKRRRAYQSRVPALSDLNDISILDPLPAFARATIKCELVGSSTLNIELHRCVAQTYVCEEISRNDFLPTFSDRVPTVTQSGPAILLSSYPQNLGIQDIASLPYVFTQEHEVIYDDNYENPLVFMPCLHKARIALVGTPRVLPYPTPQERLEYYLTWVAVDAEVASYEAGDEVWRRWCNKRISGLPGRRNLPFFPYELGPPPSPPRRPKVFTRFFRYVRRAFRRVRERRQTSRPNLPSTSAACSLVPSAQVPTHPQGVQTAPRIRKPKHRRRATTLTIDKATSSTSLNDPDDSSSLSEIRCLSNCLEGSQSEIEFLEQTVTCQLSETDFDDLFRFSSTLMADSFCTLTSTTTADLRELSSMFSDEDDD